MDKPTRTSVLTTALEGREQEVMSYQINIDNYSLAIEHISALPDEQQLALADFKQQLHNLLASERLEQMKAKVMLHVIQQQLS